MDHFAYQGNQLFAENQSILKIVNDIGSPCYIYSRETLQRHFRVFEEAFDAYPHHICYAVKANSNIALLKILTQMGSWFDIVSLGELERVLLAGAQPEKIVFSGVGKRADEIKRAIEAGIFCFNVESRSELEKIHHLAKQAQKIVHISLRINPNICAKTHPYISTGLKDNKFGIPFEEIIDTYLYAQTLDHLKIVGLGCHIGSQILELAPFQMAMRLLLKYVDTLKEKNIFISHIDIGGGLGICYGEETPPSVKEYAQILLQELKGRNIPLLLEPGRALVGNAGILVTQVEYLKHSPNKNFAIVDAAMNDLMRPALYEAWQNIIPVTLKETQEHQKKYYDIVGPVCETSDFLAKDRKLFLQEGDFLAIRTAGAYGFCMSSQYNSRPRAAEVLVSNNTYSVIRERECLEDLWSKEKF